MVRDVCLNMLQVMDNVVVAVESGVEAVRVLTESHTSFDLMLLDESMPEMDGLATLKKLLASGVRLKVVLISGGNTSLERYDNCADLRPIGVLPKPFSLKRLSDALALALL
jgi:CheY-like chemotaxis protein